MLSDVVDWLIDPWHILFLCALMALTGKIFKRPSWYKWSAVSAMVIVLVIGCSPLSTWLIGRLENQYKSLHPADLTGPRGYDVLVLGGGHIDDANIPALSQLGLSSLARLTEGVRVSRQLAVSSFTLSGFYPHGDESHAQVMKDAAIGLGIDRGIIKTLDETLSTMDEAKTYAAERPSDPFILVTSAAHMPRSMKTFKALGMNPIAAPADFKVKQDPQEGGLKFYSPGEKFHWFRLAMHEYLGMLYYHGKL